MHKRVLLKLSGEFLQGETPFGIDPAVLKQIAEDLKQVKEDGTQVAVVIGGGNLFRGKSLSQHGLCRISSDYMGMLGTIMNALAMRDVFERSGLECVIMSSIPMSGIVEHYDRRKAMQYLAENRLVIFAGGTGTPLVTTDSAASLRGIEIEADVLLKATRVDGIYDCDPEKNPSAKLLSSLTYQEALSEEYGVMDLAAFCQCRDHNLPIRVFNMKKRGALLRAMRGENEGSWVARGESDE